jgi:hypothetical protein
MCNHRYLIEWRPQDHEQWADIEEVPMNGSVRLQNHERARGCALAREIAAGYARAYPERACDLVITRYSCNGPLDEERLYAQGHHPEDAGVHAQKLARENVRLRAALNLYAPASAWRPRTLATEEGAISIRFPLAEDAGTRARTALNGNENEAGMPS